MNGVFTSLGNIFPNATTADYCDLISWVMDNGLPSDLMNGIQNGQVPSDLIPWLSNVMNPTRNNAKRKRTRTIIIILTTSSTRNGTAAHKSLPE